MRICHWTPGWKVLCQQVPFKPAVQAVYWGADHQYITKKRLMTARGMLRRGQPVRSAYLESGFNDYANFSKAFKAEFGLSPKDYVRQL